MSVELTEDRVPLEGIEASIEELVEMYGGEITATRDGARDLTLPLRRGVATSGSIACTMAWSNDTVTLTCNRDVDAPRGQRIALLVAGVIGALLFMLWPFFPHERETGALAWLGGAIAIAVYLITLRRTSGGIAADFLQRVAARQRASSAPSS